jgi:hypothetical protein
MNIRKTIDVINQLEGDRVIERYAIGGAVGATFYLEPVATLDVDVFVMFRPQGGLIINPQPVFDYLKSHGGGMEGEYVVIEGWPVQFLPAETPLLAEALQEAVEKSVQGTRVRVFTAEHLAAVALQTGRAKDKGRVLQFVEAGMLDSDRFREIISRHNLEETWKKFETQFLKE